MEKLKKEKKKVSIIAKNKAFVPTKNTNGITLVALVVTIIVLLILAGVTIMTLFGENGLITMAQKAKSETENAQANDIAGMGDLINEMNSILNGNGTNGGSTGEGPGGGDTPVEPEIPEGLEVGSEVTYNPSGTYEWKHKYCSSTKAEKAADGTTDAFDSLESGTGKNFNISSWRVLSIDDTTGKVELVPKNGPTTGTVYLGQAQGYNNGVKLLNDACSALYGNGSTITARSINIKDIEDYMLPAKLTDVTGSSTNYKTQPYDPYTSNKNYPVIYAQEKLSVINGTKKEDGLGLSDSPANFIERTTDSATRGKLTASTSIQPYQTYWYKDASYMSSAFKDCPQNSKVDNYYKLIMPSGTSTEYWVASRCVNTNSNYCYFEVRDVFLGAVGADVKYTSSESTSDRSLALFPVVTLSSNLIDGNATSGFSVNLEAGN